MERGLLPNAGDPWARGREWVAGWWATGISEASRGHRDQAQAGWVGESRRGGSSAGNTTPFIRSGRTPTPLGSPVHPRQLLGAFSSPAHPAREGDGQGTLGIGGPGVSRLPRPPASRGSRGAAHPGWRGRSRPGTGRSRCRGYLHLGGGRGGGPGQGRRRRAGEGGGRSARRAGERGRLGRLGPELAASGRL